MVRNGRRVLDLRERTRRLRTLRANAGNILTEDVKQAIRASRASCFEDDLSWLPDAAIVSRTRAALLGTFTHVKAFHGCRPADPASYWTEGLLTQVRARLWTSFQKVFPDVAEALLREIFDAELAGSLDETGKVFVLTDDRHFVETCGHYLIHGSEFLMVLAGKVREKWPRIGDPYERLRNVGVPTILEIDLPFDLLPQSQVNQLVASMLAEWGQSVTRQYLGATLTGDYAFVLREPIPPSCIVGHSHPASIPNPHAVFTGPSVYRSRVQACAACVA